MLPADHSPNHLSMTNHGAICRVSGRSSRGFSVLSGNSELLRSSRSGDLDHTVTVGTPQTWIPLSSMTKTFPLRIDEKFELRASCCDEISGQRAQAGSCSSAVHT